MNIVLIVLAVIVILFAWSHMEVCIQLRRMERARKSPQWERERRQHLAIALMMMAVAVVALVCMPVSGDASTLTEPAPSAAASHVQVPDASALYRRDIVQAASEVWGIDAPVARLAAQIHQESDWNPKAESGVGAKGLAQFMPATGKWLAHKFPQLGPYDPWDPRWSAHAAAVYDQYLVQRNAGATDCATWAFALSAYNGGERALHGEEHKAGHAGLNSGRWFGNVARYRDRSGTAWVQNRRYVRRILTVLEPAYIDAGWSGQAVCHA